jgi:hypothetical protein
MTTKRKKKEAGNSHTVIQPLSYRIANWIKIRQGKEIDPEDVIRIEILRSRVTYNIKGNTVLFGIHTTGGDASGILCEP